MTRRHECKYLISESVAQRVLRAARGFVRPDPYAEARPDHAYGICSLYLDSDELALYRETTEGQRTRFKLRVRSYSDEASAPVIVEIKRRRDGVVHKQRGVLDRGDLPALLAGRAVRAAREGEGHQQAIDEFGRLMLVSRAAPRLLVRYDRQAYVGAAEPNVRVTFDRRLRAAPSPRGALYLEGAGFREVPVRSVILELKFTERCPAWLLRLVQRFELRRTSCSKYCHAIAALGIRSASAPARAEPSGDAQGVARAAAVCSSELPR